MSSPIPQTEKRFIALDPQTVEVREDDGEPKRLSWYPALFDSLSEDLGDFRERIGKRAFSNTLQSDDVRALVNHDPSQILGRTSAKTLKLAVDMTGLHANTVIPDTSYGRDLLINIQNRNITGGSFMFQTLRDEWGLEQVNDEEILVRTLKEVRLFDVSPVTFPAYPATEGSAQVRSLLDSVKSCVNCPEPCDEQSHRCQGCQRNIPQIPTTPIRISLLRRRLELERMKILGGI